MDESKNKDVHQDTDEAIENATQTGADEINAETETDTVKDAKESAEAAQDNVKADKTEKKSKRADKKAEKYQEKIDELEDKVKRQLAEFENYRRRTEIEKSAMFETGAKSVVEKILPVIDNFERGLATVPEDEKGKPFAEGMNMIYKQLMAELEKIEVKPIEAVGKEFDPNLHNAVMQVESSELESGMVAQELQKGYMYRDTVLRYSMVSVVQ